VSRPGFLLALPKDRLATAGELQQAADVLYSALVVATFAPADALVLCIAVAGMVADRCGMTNLQLAEHMAAIARGRQS
jgi:hypothetical protein